MKLKVIGPNQTELELTKLRIFFSYETPVAAVVAGEWLRTQASHSATTTRHLRKWLGSMYEIASRRPQAFFDGLLETLETHGNKYFT